MSAFLKICGLARESDVRATVEMAPDALGFVFWPKSPRAVTADQVAAWTVGVPEGMLKVGVFVNQPVHEVQQVAATAGLDIVQLHGEEDSAYMNELALPVWKAGRLETYAAGKLPSSQWIQAWLLDSGTAEMPGGTGIPVNWQAAAPVVAELELPVLLAGGLQAENLQMAYDTVRPWGLDVSSGVEAEPGVKDLDSVRAFLAAGRRLD